MVDPLVQRLNWLCGLFIACVLVAGGAFAQDRATDTLAAAAEAYRQGRFEEAEALAKETLSISAEAAGVGAEASVAALSLLAAAMRDDGRADEAASVLLAALPGVEAALGPDHPRLLDIVSDLGQALEGAGKPAAALQAHRRAAEGRSARLGIDHPDTLFSRNNEAVALDALGRTEEAAAIMVDVVERSVAIMGADAPETLQSQVSLALMLDKLTRYAEAEAVHERTTAKVERVFGRGDPLTVTQKLNHAINLMIQGRPQPAIPLLEDVIEGQAVLGGPAHPAAMAARAILGGALVDLGDAGGALALYAENLELTRALQGPDSREMLAPLGNYATALMLLQRWDEAALINAERLRLAERWLSEDDADLAAIRNDLAGVLVQTGDRAGALALQRKAVAGFEVALGETHPMTAVAQVTLAELADTIAETEEAGREHRRAVALATAAMGAPEHPLILRAASNYASYLVRQGETDKAIPLLARLAVLTDATQGSTSWWTAQVHERLAAALVQAGRPVEAVAPSQRSLNARRALAERANAAEGAVTASTDLAQSAWSLVRVAEEALAGGEAELAGQGLSRDMVMETAFAATQVQGFDIGGLAIRRAAVRARATPSLATNTIALWEAALAQRRAMDADFTKGVADAAVLSASLAETADRRRALDTELAALTEKIAAAAPDFAELSVPQPADLRTLQRDVLKPDEALILLAPGPVAQSPYGHVWAVTVTGVAYARLEVSGAELAEMVGRFHAMLSQRAGASPSDGRAPVQPQADVSGAPMLPFDGDAAHRLYQMLFGDPAIAALIAPKKTWVIAPQGSLLAMPFAALLAEPLPAGRATAETFRDARWLGVERGLAVVPSVAAFRLLRSGANSPREDEMAIAYLGIGDPAFGAATGAFRGFDTDAFRTAETRLAAVRDLPRLPGTAREIATLSKVFAGRTVLAVTGEGASEPTVNALAGDGRLGRTNIIHFATHGLLSGSLSGLNEPALALSPPRGGASEIAPGMVDDGLLLASEIAQLRLNADWVVLSACNTAAGEGPDAQGLSGLARAFFFAGARGLLVTHWAVEDDIAARLVASTVGAGVGQTARSEALRAAMASVIADRSRDETSLPLSHPAVWAPFQIVGTPD
ncbi:MAG: CHAT domain-containing protein [Rhodobacteraceae bacterium]|nr:CHAT domain-containing protein [Paracoccaceae bacterium]